MDFIDQIKQFSKRVYTLKDSIQTEEATKTSIVMPFFSILGYDVFNPLEFTPEYTADVGIKKGEKVDYAIMQDGKPLILVEAKWIGEPLDKHDSQLFRYFGTTPAKFGILTNGIVYKFYSDLDEPNKMDATPFLEINILDIKDSQVQELKKFHKSQLDINEILNAASELKYLNEFKQIFASELSSPSDDLVRIFLSNIYKGQKNQNVIEKFRPILKKSLSQYINEMLNDKIKAVIHENSNEDDEPIDNIETSAIAPAASEPKIVTTEHELEAYFIVKNLLKDIVPMSDITYKDTESYLNILYKNNTRKWICRLILTGNSKVLILPSFDSEKRDIRFPIETLYDLEKYREQFIEVLQKRM